MENTCTWQYLGVDAGGSKTIAIVVDAQGHECGHGQAGSANYATVGLEQTVHTIRVAVEQAIHTANCHMPLQKAWLGIAGIGRPADYDALRLHLQPLAISIHVTNDAELVLSALADAAGVALITGTGSIAWGRDTHGTVARAGGWGHILGDEGSGYDIAHQGLQAAVRAADGRGPQTLVLDLLMQHWNIDKPEYIISRVYTKHDKAVIARLASCVFTAARQRDTVSLHIIHQAANELALLVSTVSKKLKFPYEQIPLALAGGLMFHEPDYRSQVLSCIGRQQTIASVTLVQQPALSAARAAIRLAM